MAEYDGPVIETEGLRKAFRTRRRRRVVAVDGLDLLVPPGGVHGFLGPNGSGKTTTIRMLLGLARADGGRIRLFGEPVPRALPSVMTRVGAVVEQPRFVPSFSGRRNLALLARAADLPATAVDEALDRVALHGRARERYAGYSLGMKQRLAIAATLLRSPRLLILDEPTNGLDPAGIRDIRAMITRLGDSGVTVLLSSHLLAEVQQVCRSVSIIGGGRLIASGDVRDLVAGFHVRGLRLSASDHAAATRVLSDAGFGVREQGDLLLVEAGPRPAAELGEEVSRLLAEHSIWLRELRPQRADLESVYLQLTHGHAAADPDGGAA
ncbi:MAG: ABC transporter ATP-binding protein [Nocardioidaceae bacterium]